MALNATTLKTAIFNSIKAKLDILFADPESPPTRDAVWTDICDAIATEVVNHIVANMEISGIEVDSGTPIGAVVTAGVIVTGDGGASLKSSMITAAPGQTATQSNPGTGHVA